MGNCRKCGACMNVKTIIFDNRHNKTFDVSRAISSMTITTYMTDNPGKCEFTVRSTSPLAFWEGATVSVIVDGYKMFKGFVFKKSRDEDSRNIKVTAYDQLRYLKNKDAKVFENVTSSQILAQLCDEFVLKYEITDPSTYICPPRSEDAVSLYEMVQNALDATLANTNQWFFIRDDFGVIKHLNVNSCVRPEILGDASFVTGFDYETSIDEGVYNQIKLYRDNETTGKREVFIVNDTINGGEKIKRWGILQLYEKVDESYNLSQIEDRGLKMLKYYCDTRRSLTLHCLGVKEFFAGCTFKCEISDLGDLSLDSYLLVTQCTHKFKNNDHTMDLETEVVRGG